MQLPHKLSTDDDMFRAISMEGVIDVSLDGVRQTGAKSYDIDGGEITRWVVDPLTDRVMVDPLTDKIKTETVRGVVTVSFRAHDDLDPIT